MLANKWTTSEPTDPGCYHLLLFPAWAPASAP